MATDSVTVSPTYNGDSVSLTAGMIVRLKPGANNNVVRAQADSAAHVQGVNGVVISGSSAPTGVVTVVCTGRETVQMESGLVPAVGDTVYVSATVAGKGTNVLPVDVSAIGTIADVSNYALLGTVEVDVVVSAVTPASVSGVSSVSTPDPALDITPTTGAVIVKQRVQATWPIANTRWYAVDGTSGNDAFAGFSDTSSADAGTKAKKTLAGLAAIFPLVGAGRKVVVVINQGTYSDPLDIFLQGVSGYAVNFPLVIATGTNATAGATAFLGDANDRTFVGAVTATGANASGYNPIGTPTQTTVQLVKVGGGTPGFSAEPALPLGARLRFDAATATVALRNFCVAIVGVTTTTTTNDTLLLPGVATTAGSLPVAPSTSDVCYVEMPGVNITAGCNLNIGGNSPGPGGVPTNALSPQFVGLNLGTNTRITGARTWWAFSRHAFFSTSASDQTTTAFNYRDEAGNFRQVGPVRTEGISGSAGPIGMNSNNANAPIFCAGAFSFSGTTLGTLSNGSYVAGLGLFSVWFGLDSANNQPLAAIGARTVNGQSTIRIVGTTTVQAKTAGISMQASSVPLDKIQITGVGAFPAIAMQGKSAISVTSFLTGSSGNTDVGLDLTGAANSTVLIYSTPTVTGTAGDVRLAGGQIVSWASLAATGLVDSAGNRFISVIGPVSSVKFSGGIVTSAIDATSSYMADAGTAPAVNLTAQRYPTSLRLALRLRVTKLTGAGVLTNSVTCTLYKNNAPTTMTVTLLAADATGTKYVDIAHPILFADGDDYDVRLDDNADALAGTLAASAQLEFAA